VKKLNTGINNNPVSFEIFDLTAPVTLKLKIKEIFSFKYSYETTFIKININSIIILIFKNIF